MKVRSTRTHESKLLSHFLVLAADRTFLGGAIDFDSLYAPFHHAFDEFVAEPRFVGVGKNGNPACIFDELDRLLRVESFLFDKGYAAVAQILGKGFREV